MHVMIFIIVINVASVALFSIYSHKLAKKSDEIEKGTSRIDFGAQLSVVQGIFSCIWSIIFISTTYALKVSLSPVMMFFFVWPHIIFMYNLVKNTSLYNRKIDQNENNIRLSNASANASMVMNGIIAVGILLNIIQGVTKNRSITNTRKTNGAIIIVVSILTAILSKFMYGGEKIGSYESHVNLVVKENTVLVSAGLLLFGIYIWIMG